MHAVHNSIRPRAQVRGTLGNIREDEKNFFPGFIHFESTMSCIPMLEESLKEQGRIPDRYENDQHGQTRMFEVLTRKRDGLSTPLKLLMIEWERNRPDTLH